jgi:hypothetical protein
MREVVVDTEQLEILHIGCCLSLAACFFFFSKSNVKTTSNVNDLCSGSIAGFDNELELLLMLRYESSFLTFGGILATNIMVTNTWKIKRQHRMILRITILREEMGKYIPNEQ